MYGELFLLPQMIAASKVAFLQGLEGSMDYFALQLGCFQKKNYRGN